MHSRSAISLTRWRQVASFHAILQPEALKPQPQPAVKVTAFRTALITGKYDLSARSNITIEFPTITPKISIRFRRAFQWQMALCSIAYSLNTSVSLDSAMRMAFSLVPPAPTLLGPTQHVLASAAVSSRATTSIFSLVMGRALFAALGKG